MPGPPPGAADAIGRGGNPPLLATGRGRGRTGRDRARTRTLRRGRVRRRRTRAVGRRRRARHLDLGGAASARSDGDGRRGGLGLRARRFLGAQRFHASGFEARGFGGDRFLLGGERGGGFRGRGGDSRLLFGGGLHVGRLSATPDRLAGRA